MMQSLLIAAPVNNKQGQEVQTGKENSELADSFSEPTEQAASFEQVMQESMDKTQVSPDTEAATPEVLPALLINAEQGAVQAETSVEINPEQLLTTDSGESVDEIAVTPSVTTELVEAEGESELLQVAQGGNNTVTDTAKVDSAIALPNQGASALSNQGTEETIIEPTSKVTQVAQTESIEQESAISEVNSTQGITVLSSAQDSESQLTKTQTQLISDIEAAQQASAIVTPLNQVSDDKKLTVSESWLTGADKTGKVGAQQSIQTNLGVKQAELAKQESSEAGQGNSLFSKGAMHVSANQQQGDVNPLKAELLANNSVDEEVKVMPSLRTEAHQSATPVLDVNGSKPIQTSMQQSDKLVALNQQMQASNQLLDEPLDIKSKQSATMMGERVLMMIAQGRQELQIRLDPAELGSMNIKVQVQQDQVNLNIQTQASLSKDIIEQNMPRLREQLAQQGIQLGESHVEQQAQQQGQQNQQQGVAAVTSGQSQGGDSSEEQANAVWIPSPVASEQQGIDFYA